MKLYLPSLLAIVHKAFVKSTFFLRKKKDRTWPCGKVSSCEPRREKTDFCL